MSQTEQQENNYDAQYLEIFGCNHSTRQMHSEKLICQQCGIFINSVIELFQIKVDHKSLQNNQDEVQHLFSIPQINIGQYLGSF
ncbi:unnamed protein product (macronuclear) [Paramecium tetraurelia]|uniref:Uncharacterized protein n=1 Tax=Paramecium tetraurelia TaxID=5888 RepID=A0BQW7_PARTE|nr:uncharacterized protein GSPATT00031163001 [Paramecium tetraurelia]CAK60934.1 unnamed protein product [Paramecium tetraurelia]|eukprot:XP_001428332.1 hypothetical protein (macronuclear) [Paramecium tetraurelia strain d4-2]